MDGDMNILYLRYQDKDIKIKNHIEILKVCVRIGSKASKPQSKNK